MLFATFSGESVPILLSLLRTSDKSQTAKSYGSAHAESVAEPLANLCAVSRRVIRSSEFSRFVQPSNCSYCVDGFEIYLRDERTGRAIVPYLYFRVGDEQLKEEAAEKFNYGLCYPLSSEQASSKELSERVVSILGYAKQNGFEVESTEKAHFIYRTAHIHSVCMNPGMAHSFPDAVAFRFVQLLPLIQRLCAAY